MKKILQSEAFQLFEPIMPQRIPEIDLYMDQVLTFLTERLCLQNVGGTEKMLTKTMINNYSKDKLLPPSKNKKYTREHMLLLILIYHMKQTLSINDIETVTRMLYSHEDTDLFAVYDSFIQKQEKLLKDQDQAMAETVKMAGLPQADHDKQQIIETILELVLEANLRKQLAERLVHLLRAENEY